MEAITAYLRFRGGIAATEFNKTAPFLLQIHHMFWSLPLLVLARKDASGFSGGKDATARDRRTCRVPRLDDRRWLLYRHLEWPSLRFQYLGLGILPLSGNVGKSRLVAIRWNTL